MQLIGIISRSTVGHPIAPQLVHNAVLVDFALKVVRGLTLESVWLLDGPLAKVLHFSPNDFETLQVIQSKR